jgi:hypothetical protein
MAEDYHENSELKIRTEYIPGMSAGLMTHTSQGSLFLSFPVVSEQLMELLLRCALQCCYHNGKHRKDFSVIAV